MFHIDLLIFFFFVSIYEYLFSKIIKGDRLTGSKVCNILDSGSFVSNTSLQLQMIEKLNLMEKDPTLIKFMNNM
ncbi:hypothetical protein RchiOBHm_Chr7g0215071 [Rosa chinensis]|uniref:Uncharacterized protein n=1 Tax=Rosa chinensis TaxID=74649 RepID=A0A2P6PBD8_ROSCH|nr:hypothetical protein RchiOBHm_Chr7g0215071 [Rosa chinensis]